MRHEANRPGGLTGAVGRRVGLATATAGLLLAGCTAPDQAPSPVEQSPTPIVCQEQAWAYGRLTRQLSPEEFLSRVVDADVERVSAILYPEDHPRAGEFIPVEQWKHEQKVAWDIYITTRGNWPVGAELC